MKKPSKIAQTRSFISIVTICVVMILATVITTVRADQFDEQIRSLQSQNDNSQAASNQLAAQASSYIDAINKLQVQISALQEAIAANQQKSDDLKQQIVKAEEDIAYQKKVLGKNIKAMYLEGDTSTLEILASSSARSEQSQLLAYTEGQKAAYDQQIKSNNAQISTLRAQQAAANAKLGGRAVAGDPGHGGYPAYLDNAAQDSLVDPWGMFNRECVSYTAWKVYQTFGHMPYWGGVGNANQWPADARNWGIPTGSTPRPHSVAISMSGYYGHAMWVEGVSGNTIYVSQYNYDLQGHYSEMSLNGSGLIYIYFE